MLTLFPGRLLFSWPLEAPFPSLKQSFLYRGKFSLRDPSCAGNGGSIRVWKSICYGQIAERGNQQFYIFAFSTLSGAFQRRSFKND